MSPKQQPALGRVRRIRTRSVRFTVAFIVMMAASVSVAACGSSTRRGHGARDGGGASATSRVRDMTTSSTATTGASADADGGVGSLPSRRQQEKVLDAVYARMRAGKAGGGDPGPKDIMDYGIGKLWSKGIDGAGTTIAFVEGWDSPMIAKYVRTYFDSHLGLPKLQIRTIYPSAGHRLPTKCPAAVTKFDGPSGCLGWESEAYLDVRAAHLIAPYAKIVIAATLPDSEGPQDAGEFGSPEFMQAVEEISSRHLANVISSSGYSGESGFKYGRNEVTAEDPGELTAAAAGIPFVSITGDDGAAQPTADARGVTRKRDVAVWADSPWTLAVGGSLPSSPTSSRLDFSSGAGRSRIFTRPAYQNDVASATHSRMRSVPDITMDGLHGTSEAAPMMAGVLALATQANHGQDLGPINTALYDTLGPKGAADGITDITKGSDTAGSGKAHVPGFSAGKGFDIASGWGTIYAPRFVPALVRATRASGDEHAARSQATAALTSLRTAVHLTPLSATGARTSRLTATGFVPRLPVVLSIDGHRVSTLHADTHGDITDTINPAALHVHAGTHTITLRSMLITVTGQFTTR